VTARVLALACLLASGCAAAGTMHAYRLATPDASTAARGSVTTTSLVEERRLESGGGSAPSFWFDEGEAADYTTATTASTPPMEASGSTGMGSEAAPERQLYAQAQTSVTPPPPEATDAVDTSGELLVYTALFHVGVYDVEAGQAAIAESARSMGGFVFSQSDDAIVVRVPAARFMAFMGQIDSGYDVLHREVQAQDVGDEFRDVEVRIRNLQAERDGIAALLERGLSVEQVLVVERELERVTSELEQMRARQRFLADRIALSTITVMFRPQPHDTIDQPEVFQLPFAWLESLGLPNLLELR
jgi:hypothetical protein